MVQMDFIRNILLYFFSKLSWEYFDDHTLRCILFVHSTLILRKQWRHTQISINVIYPYAMYPLKYNCVTPVKHDVNTIKYNKQRPRSIENADCSALFSFQLNEILS